MLLAHAMRVDLVFAGYVTPSVVQKAAEARDNETRHWNVDDYMVARRGREKEKEREDSTLPAAEGRESEPRLLLLNL